MPRDVIHSSLQGRNTKNKSYGSFSSAARFQWMHMKTCGLARIAVVVDWWLMGTGWHEVQPPEHVVGLEDHAAAGRDEDLLLERKGGRPTSASTCALVPSGRAGLA